jgi:hypothetical protein
MEDVVVGLLETFFLVEMVMNTNLPELKILPLKDSN